MLEYYRENETYKIKVEKLHINYMYSNLSVEKMTLHALKPHII